MRRAIMHPAVALFTFGIGIVASSLFYSASPAPLKVIKPGVVVEHGEPVFPSSCGCHQTEDGHLAEEFSVTPTAPIRGGILNGKAINLPPPSYPTIARAAHASGTVSVQVVINGIGCVISSRAVSGHPLLRSAAVKAGYEACFTPTFLSGVPVKVTGILTYDFVLDERFDRGQRF